MKRTLPIPANRALRKLGEDIKNARKRRRISTTLMSERAGLTRATLLKIEKGEASVSMGNYARVLFVLGLCEQLGNICDLKYDPVGLLLEDEQLPKRIRYKNKK